MSKHVEFSAVTKWSIYNVREDVMGEFIIYKIPTRRVREKNNGHHVMFVANELLAVTRSEGIFPYHYSMCATRDDSETNCYMPENVPMFARKGVKHTSSVLALFFLESDAHTCFDSSNPAARCWLPSTKGVLADIQDHTFIKVSHDQNIGFPEEFFA